MYNHPFDLIQSLHQSLYPRFHKNNLNLRAANKGYSVTDYEAKNLHIVTYLRPVSDVENIERMMGCDGRSINLRRHPVIELRCTEQGVALEFVVAPDAWWDQRNFTAKLSVSQHRRTFRRLLASLSDEFMLTFSGGLSLSELSLSMPKAAHPAVFDQLMSTYTDRDWFRVGVWYSNEEITEETGNRLFNHIKDLNRLYEYVSWNSNNDFRAFSEKDNDIAYA